MELVGDGVKLVGEDEVVEQRRQRAKSGGRINQASDTFVKAFTKVYPKLAEQAPVYAQLRNCIDLAVAAAFIQHQDYYDLAKWKPETLASEQAFPVETLNPPQQVETAVNALWRGNTLMTPIGGGVQMRPTEAVDPTNLLEDDGAKVKDARAGIDLSKLGPDQWWWDSRMDALEQLEEDKLRRWHEGNELAIEQSRQGLSKPIDLESLLDRVEKRFAGVWQ